MARFLYLQAQEKKSFLTQMHPITALVLVAAIVIIVFSTLNLYVYTALFLLLLGAAYFGKLPLKGILTVVLVIVPLVFFITLIQVLAQTQDIVFTWHVLGRSITFSRYGFILGLQVAFRVVLLAITMTTFFMAVHPVRLTKALYDAGMNFKYAYAFSLALRFLPLVLSDLVTINNAQKSRGYDIDRQNFLIRTFRLMPLAVPLILSGLRRAEIIALAMDLRGFCAYDKRTFYVDVKPSRWDPIIRWGSLALALVFVAVAIWSPAI